MATRAPDWLERLNAIQQEAVCDVLDQTRDKGFHPHVTLAYSNGPLAGSAVALTGEKTGLRDLTIAHPRVTLMEIHRDHRQYQWRVLDQRPLCRPAP